MTRHAEQINGREGAHSDLVIASHGYFRRAFWRFRPTSSQSLAASWLNMKISLVKELQNDISLLRSKKIHVVGFAEVGMSFFRTYLEFAFAFSLEEAIALCEKINAADETGTIYPKGFLTGMPVRFFRQHMSRTDLEKFRACLRDAFIANRDYCKSKVMAFHLACAIDNRDLIIDETITLAQAITDDSQLKSLVIVADELEANTPVQKNALQNSV